MWQRHPLRTVFGALVANLFMAPLFGYFGILIEDCAVSNPAASLSHLADLASYGITYLVFAIAVYLTGWGADSRLQRLCVVIVTSVGLMVAWFICIFVIYTICVRISDPL